MTASTVTIRPVVPALSSLYERLSPFAEPLIRVAAGLLLVPHGAQKLFGWFGGYGIEGTGQFMASLGFEPGALFAVLVGAAEFFGTLLKTELRANPRTMLGALLAKPAFDQVRARMDYEEYGGAPLVGLNNAVIIAHGRSNAKAIASTLRLAQQTVARDVTGKINQRVAALLNSSETSPA